MTGMFTGCGSSQQAAGSSGAEAGQTQTGDNSLFNEPGQLPIVNEPVTLTVHLQIRTAAGKIMKW